MATCYMHMHMHMHTLHMHMHMHVPLRSFTGRDRFVLGSIVLSFTGRGSLRSQGKLASFTGRGRFVHRAERRAERIVHSSMVCSLYVPAASVFGSPDALMILTVPSKTTPGGGEMMGDEAR